MAKKTRTAVYSGWTYDVWGNARDGWDVNDRSCFNREIRIICKARVYNPGTEHESTQYTPTDRQLSRAAGFKGVQWDGETEYTLTAETRRGRPVGELCFVRWES